MTLHSNQEYLENGTIQIAPLAFMRGRTLTDAVVTLDEAQKNTHPFAALNVFNSYGAEHKKTVTGDITQIDLPTTQKSGLIDAMSVLKNVKGVSRVDFDKSDIVRHKLVQKIVEAYERSEEQRVKTKEQRQIN